MFALKSSGRDSCHDGVGGIMPDICLVQHLCFNTLSVHQFAGQGVAPRTTPLFSTCRPQSDSQLLLFKPLRRLHVKPILSMPIATIMMSDAVVCDVGVVQCSPVAAQPAHDGSRKQCTQQRCLQNYLSILLGL